MSLVEHLPLAQIVVPLRAETPAEAIAELLAVLPLANDLTRHAARRAVLARENEAATGIGGGVAIPHGRSERLDGTYCALGISPNGIAWGALDNQPCRIVLLCVTSPADSRRHVVLLGELAALLNDGARRGALAAATTPARALAALA